MRWSIYLRRETLHWRKREYVNDDVLLPLSSDGRAVPLERGRRGVGAA